MAPRVIVSKKLKGQTSGGSNTLASTIDIPAGESNLLALFLVMTSHSEATESQWASMDGVSCSRIAEKCVNADASFKQVLTVHRSTTSPTSGTKSIAVEGDRAGGDTQVYMLYMCVVLADVDMSIDPIRALTYADDDTNTGITCELEDLILELTGGVNDAVPLNMGAGQNFLMADEVAGTYGSASASYKTAAVKDNETTSWDFGAGDKASVATVVIPAPSGGLTFMFDD